MEKFTKKPKKKFKKKNIDDYFPYFTCTWNNLPKILRKKNIDDFKIELKTLIKHKIHKFYSKGNKYKNMN